MSFWFHILPKNIWVESFTTSFYPFVWTLLCLVFSSCCHPVFSGVGRINWYTGETGKTLMVIATWSKQWMSKQLNNRVPVSFGLISFDTHPTPPLQTKTLPIRKRRIFFNFTLFYCWWHLPWAAVVLLCILIDRFPFCLHLSRFAEPTLCVRGCYHVLAAVSLLIR